MLTPHLGNLAARTSIRLAARRIGVEPGDLHDAEIPRLIDAILPMLKGVMGLQAADALAGEIRSGLRPEADAGAAPEPAPHSDAGETRGHIGSTTFIGRKLEIEGLGDLLTYRRLVTVTGPGGIGKSRLAHEFASAVEGRFRDGFRSVEVATIADGALVPQAISMAVGVREEKGRPLGETLLASLHARQLLLILDNCEHMIDACATVVRSILSGCSGVRILVTSREPLGVTGESVWPVVPLGLPGPDGDLDASEAARLFVDRARRADPSFSVSAATAPVIANLCRRLDGIPLALELAAAQIRFVPLDRIADHLDDEEPDAEAGAPLATSHHHTMRAAIAWSYGLLSRTEKLMLERLSVFVGGTTLWAIGAVCEGEGVDEGTALGLVSRLVDKSLVFLEEDGFETRYRMLEPIREYAARRLRESGDDVRLRVRHLDYSIRLAEQAWRELRDGQDQGVWLERLEREHDNMRAALEWCKVRREAESGLRLAGALGQFWVSRGYWAEGRAWLESELAAGAGVAPLVRARALYMLGYIIYFQGEVDLATRTLEETLALTRREGDLREAANTLRTLGNLFDSQGMYDRAQACLEEGLELSRGLGDHRGIAITTLSLGLHAMDRGETARALAYLEESLALFRASGNGMGIGIALHNIGELLERDGDLDRAETCLRESRDLARGLGDTRHVAHSTRVLGIIAARRGAFETASELYAEALRLDRDLGDRQGIAQAMECLGRLMSSLGRFRDAALLAGAAAALRVEIHFPLAPSDQAVVDEWVGELREEAGGAVDAWFDEGRELSFERAVELALALTE